MDEQAAYQALLKKLSSQHWRLNHLYYIRASDGGKIPFRMNWMQEDLYKNLWYSNAILKARQLGATTFIMLYMLDACLFNSNHSAGVIAHTREDAEDLFTNKIRFAYDNLPPELRAAIPATQDTARKLVFNNGSSITVGTSLRSGTMQKLLVSEYGKIAARYPEKAKEIKTGALNTVHVGQQIFVESTAEGNSGEFFELCETARKLQEEGRTLTQLDPKFHFYPWYKNPSYILGEQDISNTIIDAKLAEYLNKIPGLTPGQKAWYAKKAQQQGEDIKREFPSFPHEAFEQSMEGAYYTQQMNMVRRGGQITRVPYEPGKPVHTWWDLGINDSMTIWFFQHIGKEYRFIDYYESSGEGLQHYANHLRSLGYVYGEHLWPHDGTIRDLSSGRTRMETARELGIWPIRIVPRTKNINDDIQAVRTFLPRAWFDEVKCSQGIKHLDNYRKEWDDRLGQWKDKPRHDQASHGCDAFRTGVLGYKGRVEEFVDYGERQQYAEADYDYFKL